MICAGIITSLHGLRGCLKVKHYLEDVSVFDKAPVLIDNLGFDVLSFFCKGSCSVVMRLQGVESKDAAVPFINKEIFIKEELLPSLAPDQYYQKDLIGLRVHDNYDFCGKVFAMHNFGASDIMEVVSDRGKKMMLPFVKEFVLSIDMAAQKICIKIPEDY